jgi:hypothetical protein
MKPGLVAFVAVSLSALPLNLAAPPQAPASKPPPLIVGVVGEWRECQNGEPAPTQITFLSTLSDQSTIVLGKSGALTVQFNDSVASFPCDQTDTDKCPKRPGYACVRLIKRPETGHVAAVFSGLMAVVAPLVSRDPERYIAPASRGLDPELMDGVVATHGNAVDFAPVFADLEAGSYTVRLEPLDKSLKPAEANASWKEGGAAVATIPSLSSGLYRVTRLVKGVATGETAWVLVTPADQFEKRSDQYKRAVEATRQWPSDVDARAPRAVLRGYLQALSNGTP